MAKEYTRTFSKFGSVRPLGPILLFDDLEQLPLKWRLVSATTSAHNRITTNALNGSSCLQLISTSIFIPASINIVVERDINTPSGGIYACELAAAFFTPIAGSVSFDIEMQCHHSSLVTGAIRWNNSTLELQIKNSTGSFLTIGTFNPNQALNSWHKFQLVLDAVSVRYISIEADSQKFPHGQINPQAQGLPPGRGSVLQLRANGSDEALPEINIDDILVSQSYLP